MLPSPSIRRSDGAARSRPRAFAVGPRAAAAGLLTALALLGWAGASSWYILSRDEIAQRVFVRETEMRLSYEDRIGQLSARLEREMTQNMVERRGFETRVGAIAARQAEIEARQAWLRSAAERVTGGATSAPLAGFSFGSQEAIGPAATAIVAPKPAPLDPPALRSGHDPSETGAEQRAEPRDRLSLIERSLERTAVDERRLVEALGRAAKLQVARLRSAFDVAGIGPADGRTERVGGPLVALPPNATANGFGFLIASLDLDFAEMTRLRAAARTAPIGSPLPSDIEQTSGFGYRLDPFTRAPALHTGLDFRAETGTPAHATGAGRVVTAEYSGGYGNLVEIDHGGGLTTRYGHLSAFAVAAGDRVEAGQVIGRTGSTGRSTGAHLHYETRVNGEPVNPLRFLEAGRLLGRRSG